MNICRGSCYAFQFPVVISHTALFHVVKKLSIVKDNALLETCGFFCRMIHTNIWGPFPEMLGTLALCPALVYAGTQLLKNEGFVVVCQNLNLV